MGQCPGLGPKLRIPRDRRRHDNAPIPKPFFRTQARSSSSPEWSCSKGDRGGFLASSKFGFELVIEIKYLIAAVAL